MKIVYCTDDLWQSGGTERVTTTKLNWWAGQPDVEVWVVTLKENREPFFRLADGVHRIMLDVHPSDRKAYRRELARVLGEIRPDVSVAVSGMAVDALYRVNDGSLKVLEFHYTRNFLVNFVKGLHHIRFRSLHLLKMRWLQWKLKRQSTRYDLFVGLTRRDVGLWGNPKNMTFVHNPLSFRSERKSTCESHRIICVGSWTPAKGQEQLLEAFGPLAARYPDWRVDLYGQGQNEELLRSIIRKYDMTRQVTLHEPCADIAGKLVESSIYAFPSRSDGFGLVITEAMECGLPTAAMDCQCGPCEIVTDNTGIVVPDGDIVAFRNALERLMSDADLRKAMGRSAAKEVKRFYPDAIMAKWQKIFEQRHIKS